MPPILLDPLLNLILYIVLYIITGLFENMEGRRIHIKAFTGEARQNGSA